MLASGFWDNANLDAWEIPFGLWIEEIVFWLTTHITGFLDAVKWPVDQLLELIINNLLQDWLPWPVVLLFFFLLGAATRNFLVGLGSAAGLLICGLLGNEYWDLTMETIGMIIVAVMICTVIGIPLGILAARIDSFWSRLRPVLDGMWLSLLGALIVLGGGAGAAFGMRSGDGPARVGTREVAGMVVLALFLGFAGASGSWILDPGPAQRRRSARRGAGGRGGGRGSFRAP